MKRVSFLLVVATALFSMTILSRAQSSAGYDVSWWTNDSGGSLNNTGGAYSLSGTFGQPDAVVAQGSGYTLSGGFWRDGSSVLPKTSTPTATRTSTPLKSSTPTATRTSTPLKSSTPTATPTSTLSNTSKSPTPTATRTATPLKSSTPTATRTATPLQSSTPTATITSPSSKIYLPVVVR
jgi:hypothetical protein